MTSHRFSVLLVVLATPVWACCPNGMWGPLTSPVVSFTRQYPYGGILGNPIEFMFSGHDLDVCLETGSQADDGLRPLQWWINDANGQEVAWGEQFTSLWVRDPLGGWDIVFKFYWDPAAAGDYTVYVWAEDNAYLADDDPDAYASKAVYVRPLIDPDTDDYLCGNCDDCQATIKTQFMPETNDATFTLQIKDAAAQVVRTLADEVAQDGMLNGQGWTHRTDTWDGKDDAGQFVPPGVYTVSARWTVPRMEAEPYTYTGEEAMTVIGVTVDVPDCASSRNGTLITTHLEPEGLTGDFKLTIQGAGTVAEEPRPSGDYEDLWQATVSAGQYDVVAEWTVGGVTCRDTKQTTVPEHSGSEAYLKVFTQWNANEHLLSNEKYSPLGGTVYPVLYVRVGARERIKAGTDTVTVRITDLYDDYFDGTDVDHDLLIDLTTPAGWEVQDPDSSWRAPGLSPAAYENTDCGSSKLFRYVLTWNTAKEPLGNNGDHELSAAEPLQFQEWAPGGQWINDYEAGPEPVTTTLENLHLTNATAMPGNIDYFKWDPDSSDNSLQHPHLQFTIADADPHKYCVIVKYRTTIGEGTWNWDSGWWSKRHVLGTTMTADIDLTAPDMNGNYLGKDPDQEWGTYTYDILVLEYAGADPIWTEGAALDCNFLKRCRDGYHLWVPANLPAPNGDKPGHLIWKHVAEGPSSVELRGYYCLHSEHGLSAQDVKTVVVDPLLAEQASVSGSGAVDTGHGTDDADQDGQFDGLLLYTFQDDDFGTWRAVLTAADSAGPRSPNWRTHELIRMLVGNSDKRPEHATFGVNQNELINAANHAHAVLLARHWVGFRHETPPEHPSRVRTAIIGSRDMGAYDGSDIVFIAGHGMYYGTMSADDAVYDWHDITVTDPGAVGPNHHHGDAIMTRERDGWGWWDDMFLCTHNGVAKRLLDGNQADPSALLTDGSTTLESPRGGGPARSGQQCNFLFVTGCLSAHSADSFVPYAISAGGVKSGLGFTRSMNTSLACDFAERFWNAFATLPRLDLAKARFYTSIAYCHETALNEFWTFHNGTTRAPTDPWIALEDVRFRGSDMLRWPREDPPCNVKGEFTWIKTP